MSRTRKSAWNLSTGLLLTVLGLGISIFSTPWLLHWLGTERFGAYRVLLDWGGYIALFELGLSGALVARLAVAQGKGDQAAMRGLIAAGLRLYGRVTLLMAAAGLVWVVVLPRLISLDSVGRWELRMAGLVSLAGLLLTPLMVFRSVAESRQRGYVVSLLLTVQSVLTTALLLATAWAGWGLIGQCLATVSAQLFLALALLWEGLRNNPGVLREPAKPETTRDLWALNWPTFAFNLSGRVGLLTDNIIVAWSLGSVAVAPFYLTQRLASLALAQLQGVGNATWAGLVELHAQGREEVFRHRLLELTRLVSGLGVCVLGPIAAYNHHFVARWVGAGNFAGEAVGVLACVNVWFWAVFSLWGWPISGTGNIARWMPYAMVSSAVNLIVSLIATTTLGLIGPLVGTLTAFMLVQVWGMTRVLGQLFALSPGELWRHAVQPLWWGGAYAVGLWWWAHRHTPQGWIELLLEMALAGLGGLCLWWLVGCNAEVRRVWMGRLQVAVER
ncbi:MAG: oligosaccharide flippase family protein [Acidobacteriota bacterium]